MEIDSLGSPNKHPSWIMLAFHDADRDSPNTATILRPTHAISSRGKIVAVFGESVSVSASWNASFKQLSHHSSQTSDMFPMVQLVLSSRLILTKLNWGTAHIAQIN